MGFRLIRNVSPARIKVNVTVENPEGQHVTFELKYGESVLVHDTSVATKPIIVQKRKGNIDIIDDFFEDMVPYQKYPYVEKVEQTPTEELDSELGNPFEKEEEESPKEHFENGPSSIEEVTTESEIVKIETPKTKGGRPKGSDRKPLTKAQIKKRRREQYQLSKTKNNESDNSI
jgi:hypothetical protein